MDRTEHDGSAAAGCQRNAYTLQYTDVDLERRFFRFLVPRAPVSLVVMYVLIALAAVAIVLNTDDLLEWRYPFLVYLLVMVVVQSTLVIVERKVVSTEIGRDRIRQVSSFGVLVGIFYSTLLSSAVYYGSNQESSCDDYTIRPKTREGAELNCANSFSVDSVGLIVTAILLHDIRFTTVVVISIASTVVSATLWMAFTPVKNFNTTVVQSTVYIAMSSVFLCAIRRDHEIAQRDHFESILLMDAQIEHLKHRRKTLLRFSQSVLPRSLLRKIASQTGAASSPLTTRESAAPQTDFNARATVVIVGAQGLDSAGRTMLDTDVSRFVTSLQEHCERFARRSNLDVIRVIGDHFAAVGNLLEPKADATPAAMRLGLRASEITLGCLGVRAAVNVGSLYGRFVGSRYVRYDVSGPAFDNCYRAWLHGGSGDVIATQTVTEEHVLAGDEATFQFTDHVTDKISENDTDSTISWQSTKLYLVRADPGSLNDSHQKEQLESAPPSESYPSLIHRGDEEEEEEEGTSFSAIAEILDKRPAAACTSSFKGHPSVENQGVRSSADDTFEKNVAPHCCGMLVEFTDPSKEARYVEHRQTSLAGRARFVWTAYAAFLAGLLLLAVADLRGSNAPLAVVLLVITICLALIVGTLPAVWSSDEWRRYVLAWSVLGSVVPLLAVISVALTRPSAVGNDVRVLFTLGCLVRSYTFPNVRVQLVLTPVLVGLASLQYLLPYAAMRVVYTYYAIVLWSLFVDAERDRSLRSAFFTRERIESVLASLREEERLRDGLIRSTLPDPVYRRVVMKSSSLHREPLLAIRDRPTLAFLNDTTVCLMSFSEAFHGVRSASVSHAAGGGSEGSLGSIANVLTTSATASDSYTTTPAADVCRLGALSEARFKVIEVAVAKRPDVAILGVAGDQVMLGSPLMTSIMNLSNSEASRIKERGLIQVVSCALEVDQQMKSEVQSQDRVNMSAIIDCDATMQCLRLSECPRFAMYGVAPSRVISLASNIELPPGVLSTERAGRILMSALDANDVSITTTALDGRWAVRGVGIVRLLRLSWVERA